MAAVFSQLLSARRFAPLFWTQFLGALNDNLVKNAIAILVLVRLAEHGPAAVTAAGLLLTLPFLLFSSVAGEVADGHDKAKVARVVKGLEIGAAAVALAGFALGSVPVLFAALFLTGTLSTFFGPVKYAILPDHVRKDELVAANALVEAGTFAAILAGTVAGGLLAAVDPVLAGLAAVACAVAAFGASWMMPAAPAAAPGLRADPNIARSTVRLLRDLKAAPGAWGPAIAVSWFWAVGAAVLALVPAVVSVHLGGDETVAMLFLALFTVGIGLGSVLAALVSGGRIVRSLVPFGALGMSVAAAVLSWTVLTASPAPGADWAAFLSTGSGLLSAAAVVALAAFGGLFAVPAFAALQTGAGEGSRARAIAGNNVLNSVFMVVAAGALMVAQMAGATPGALLAAVAALNLLAVPAVGRLVRASYVRDLAFVLVRLAYRVEVEGLENVSDARAPRVVAVNHQSLMDAVVVMSVLPCDPVFAVDTGIAAKWWCKPFLKLVRAFPVDPTKPLNMRAMTNLVKAGETLVIFPEGRITLTGSLMKVYDGTAMVADRAGAEVVLVRLEGLERSPFSYLKGDAVSKTWFPKVRVRAFPAVRLSVPEGLRGKARRQAAGRELQDVMTAAAVATAEAGRTIPLAVIEAARTHGWGRTAVADPLGTELSYRKLLAGASALGRALDRDLPAAGRVGLMLPNSAGAAVSLLALMKRGLVPAMLNFTAGPANLASACRTAEVGVVLTSRAFVEKAKLERELEAISAVAGVVFLEDVRGRVGTLSRILGLLSADRTVDAGPDSPAVVLFTSGSEGEPKGVVLSHRNVLSNCAQVASRFDMTLKDSVFNVLPVFHSFGLTGGLVLPLVSGVETFLYPSPLHYRIVPEMVYARRSTIMFGTDVFLAGYARSAHSYDFSSLRYVVAGAEPVRPETRRVYADRFGIRVLEGYGVTECAPVVAVNTPMESAPGTVGRLLPGIEHRLERVEGVEGAGRLHVRGPNVMLGYLLPGAPGELVPPAGGWHDTGDVVSVDPAGYVTIRGRAKRFAKLAGEMVSLAAVEAYVSAAWPDARHVAVAAADGRKGERVVLLTTAEGVTRADVQARARAAGATELMVPAEVRTVAEIPLLGSGKVDFAAAGRLAA